MSVIRILRENVANQIAAGEVVERPASVAKELVENSLDAGAQSVQVHVESGGRRLIRVSDDGCGMSRDDTLLAFERHATSKIQSAEDLDQIATLGFRGEALPSIAAVSRLTLETRHASEEVGTRLEISGGKLRDVKDAVRPCGTQMEVKSLFFNTPARRKFLRTESTELGHITSMVTHYALANPDKAFQLTSMSNEILKASPVSSHRERVYQVLGGQALEQLVEFGPMERPGPRFGPPELLADTEGEAESARRALPDFRFRLAPGSAQAQPKPDLLFRQPPADPRPAGSARAHRGLPEHSALGRLSRWRWFSWIFPRGRWTSTSILPKPRCAFATDTSCMIWSGIQCSSL